LNPVTNEILIRRAKHLGNLPAMPCILRELTKSFNANAVKMDVDEIVKTISYDKSLVAQCLRMANSAMYRSRTDVNTVRESILALGLWRIRDLAFSCNLPLMFANLDCAVPKEAFWRHALATGYVAQKLALELVGTVGEEVYLSGLLHDVGILINALLFPDDFHKIMDEAVRDHSPVLPIEQRILGFTHAESGRILADLWRLPHKVAEVIEFHHCPERQTTNNETTLLVQLASQLCWRFGLGYGYSLIERHQDLQIEDPLRLASVNFPKACPLNAADYAPVLESHMAEARELADRVFGFEPVCN